MRPNNTSGCLLSEIEWGAHESSLFLYLEQIDHNGEPHESNLFLYHKNIDLDRKQQDFFTSGLWRGLLHGKFSTSKLLGGPVTHQGNIFQPQEFISIMQLLVLKALQRSFKTLFPSSKISDNESNLGKCVTTSHHVNASLDQLVIGKVVAAVLHQAIVLLDKKDE